jgi:hypothetical protein
MSNPFFVGVENDTMNFLKSNLFMKPLFAAGGSALWLTVREKNSEYYNLNDILKYSALVGASVLGSEMLESYVPVFGSNSMVLYGQSLPKSGVSGAFNVLVQKQVNNDDRYMYNGLFGVAADFVSGVVNKTKNSFLS